MARPKEFNVETALGCALDVFWQKGYEATSMQDLVAAMGIQKASLYGTYGDKHSLYMATLANYQRQSLTQMEDTLTSTASPLEALRHLVFGVAEQAAGRLGKRGCFCVNANIELAPNDPAVTEMLHTHGERVEAMLEATLRRAKALGELRKGADCKRLATFLFGSIMALNVLGKQRAGRDRLQAMAEQILAAIEP